MFRTITIIEDNSIPDIAVYQRSTKTIRYKSELLNAPQQVRGSIIAHEICHFKIEEIKNEFFNDIIIDDDFVCDWFSAITGYFEGLKESRLERGITYIELFVNLNDRDAFARKVQKWYTNYLVTRK